MRFPHSVDGAIARRPGAFNTGCAALAALASALLICSCGTPGPPQAPSLKLPEPVVDLTAIRTGNAVVLHWTMPRRTTDRLTIASQFHSPVRVRICRRVAAGACQPAGETAFPGGADAEFRDTLPATLAAGEPRTLLYFVELFSPKGRSAGPSNPAAILAGASPATITGLTAQVRADGVALHWDASPGGTSAAVRLHRKLLNPPPPKPSSDNSAIKPNPEPLERDLFVDASGSSRQPVDAALDSSARFGEIYEYTAQRVLQVKDGGALELAGAFSTPIRVDVLDTFPPAVPQGLVAVFAPQEKTIDLSWEPDTEDDLAGYIVYRTESNAADWQRVSGPHPLPGPAFRDPAIEAGHSYRYAVTAIDLTGHESKRSAEAGESVPNP